MAFRVLEGGPTEAPPAAPQTRFRVLEGGVSDGGGAVRSLAAASVNVLRSPLGAADQALKSELLRLGQASQLVPSFQQVAPALGEIVRQPLAALRLPTEFTAGMFPWTPINPVLRGMERQGQNVAAAGFSDLLTQEALLGLLGSGAGLFRGAGQAIRRSLGPEVLPSERPSTPSPTRAPIVEAQLIEPPKALPSPSTVGRFRVLEEPARLALSSPELARPSTIRAEASPTTPAPEIVALRSPQKKIQSNLFSGNYVFHNTRSEFLPAITREGFSQGSFSDRPIDYGGDVWIAVKKEDLPDLSSHRVGSRTFYEPGGLESAPIHPSKILVVSKSGQILRSLTSSATPQAPQAEQPPRLLQALSRARAQAVTMLSKELRDQGQLLTVERQRLRQSVKALGGIRPSLGGGMEEELRAIPSDLIRRAGQPIDQLATELSSHGFSFENGEHLRQALIGLTAEPVPKLKDFRAEAERVLQSEGGQRLLGELSKRTASLPALERMVRQVARDTNASLAQQSALVRSLVATAQRKFVRPGQLSRLAQLYRETPGETAIGPRGGVGQAPLTPADLGQTQAAVRGLVPPPGQPTGTPPIIPRSRTLVVEQERPQGRDLTPFQSVQLSGFDPSRAAQQVDGRTFGPTEQQVIRPLRSGEIAALRERQDTVTQLRQISANMRRGSPESSHVANLLEGTPPSRPPTPREIATAQWMRQQFDALLGAINQMRQSIGKSPILRREGYMTHLRNPDLVQAVKEALFGEPLATRASQTFAGKAADFIRSRVPFFRFGLPRTGGPYERDAIQAFEVYLDAALRVKHLSVPGKLASLYVDRTLSQHPHAQDYFRRYIEAVVSRKPGNFAKNFPAPTRAAMRWVKARFGKGTILGNLSSVLQQPFTVGATTSATSLRVASLAGHWLARGDGFAFSQRWFPTVQARLLESDVSYGTLMSKWEEALAAPFQGADITMVSHAALSGYLDAVSHGATFEQAIQRGDQVALRTQSSFLKADLAPIFQDEMAAGFVQFQNTINGLFNYLKFDVPRSASPLRAAALFAGTTAALVGLYQALGLPHPDRVEDFIPGLSSVRGGPPVGRLAGAFVQLSDRDPRKRAEGWRVLGQMWPALMFGAGGGQAAKTVRGAIAVARGGKFDKRGHVQFRIEGPIESTRALAFGPYQTKAGHAYIQRGFKPEPLTESEQHLNRIKAALRRRR